MNQKLIKKKPTRCLVPSCSYNKPLTAQNSKTFSTNLPNWSEISGEIKLFFNPILQKQYNSNMDQIKLMICKNHLTYHELIKEFESRLEKAPVSFEFIELIDKVIEETYKNYDILNILNSTFDSLNDKLSKLSKRAVDKLQQDETQFLIKLLEYLKIVSRSINNRSMLAEMGLVDCLVNLIEINELKSSKDDENKIKVVSLSMLVFTSFCTFDEQKLGNKPQKVYKACWSYLSMDVPELQHQTFAFLWALLNHNDTSYKLKIKNELTFLIKRFNEYKEQWNTKTLELALMFLASVIFNENKELFSRIDEEEKKDLKECLHYLNDSKIALSEKGKYFAERAAGFIQPFVFDGEGGMGIEEIEKITS